LELLKVSDGGHLYIFKHHDQSIRIYISILQICPELFGGCSWEGCWATVELINYWTLITHHTFTHFKVTCFHKSLPHRLMVLPSLAIYMYLVFCLFRYFSLRPVSRHCLH